MKMNTKETNRTIQAEAKRIARASKLAEGFASKDQKRVSLQAPYHDKKNGVVVATDGRAMIVTRFGFDKNAADRDFPKWRQVIPNYTAKSGAVSVKLSPASVMATCTKGIRLARAISRKLEVWAAIPLPGGDRIVFDAELLRRVADAMDANGMTEIKAMGGLRPILAKNADTSIVAMPIRGSHTEGGRVASYEALLLDAVTGRVIAAPERSDTGDNGAEMAKTLRERADMYMKDGAALSAKKDLAAADRIEKRIAAEDEIDALMDATTPAPEPAPEPEPEKPQPVAEAPAAPAAPVATPWSEHEAEWRDMTARNFHDEVRVSMAEWAAACAPSVPEFAMIAGDFRLIASRQDGDGYDVDSYMEWRNDATSELLERIARAFGADVKAGMGRCL